VVLVIAGCGRLGYDPLVHTRLQDAAQVALPDARGAVEAATPDAEQPVEAPARPPVPDAAPEVGPDAAPPITFSYPNFASTTGLTLNGTAKVSGGVMVLAGTNTYQTGTFYLTNPLVLGRDTDLDAAFTIRITQQPALAGNFGPGDGMAFVLQNSPMGAKAVGDAGGGFGYGYLTPSLAFEFDLFKNPYDPAFDHVAFLRDGDVTKHLPSALAPPFDLKTGTPVYVWIEYRARAGQISAYLSRTASKPAAPSVQYGVDLPTAPGGRAFVGLAASAGPAVALFEVLALTITLSPAR
jgi:hypothetical protein